MPAEVKFIQRRSHTREIDGSVIMPQVSINGTSKGELIDQQQRSCPLGSRVDACCDASWSGFQYTPAGIEARMPNDRHGQTLIDRHT